jgi:HPt (histidine-containing phosphotransfer) domain-containing protein
MNFFMMNLLQRFKKGSNKSVAFDGLKTRRPPLCSHTPLPSISNYNWRRHYEYFYSETALCFLNAEHFRLHVRHDGVSLREPFYFSNRIRIQGCEFMSLDSHAAISSMLNDLADSLGAESVIAIVEVFRDVSHKQINTMEVASQQNDVATIKREAHSLKSSAANLGAQDLADLCADLERADELNGVVAEKIQRAKLMQTLAVEGMMNWKSNQ